VVSPLFHHPLDIAAVDSFRPHAANEVYVTGTFDDWAKTEKLEKVDAGHFEKVVQLNKVDEKILYKVCDTASLTPVVMLLPQLHSGQFFSHFFSLISSLGLNFLLHINGGNLC